LLRRQARRVNVEILPGVILPPSAPPSLPAPALPVASWTTRAKSGNNLGNMVAGMGAKKRNPTQM